MTASISGKFPASLKLKSEKRIDLLFKKGLSQFKFPIKIQYLVIAQEGGMPSTFEIGVSVSKKRFKKAVDRNILKRRMRESIRGSFIVPLRIMLEGKSLTIYIMAIFVGSNLESFETIDTAMKNVLNKLLKVINDK
jgi:ribonuclease P protein component